MGDESVFAGQELTGKARHGKRGRTQADGVPDYKGGEARRLFRAVIGIWGVTLLFENGPEGERAGA